MATNGYITIEEAQQILNLSLRQVHNYISAEKFRTRKEGRRRMLYAEDVYRLADELGAGSSREPPPPVEMLPDQGPLIDYIRELTGQVAFLSRRIGEMEGQLKMLPSSEEKEQLQEELAVANAQRDVLQSHTDNLNRELSEERQKSARLEAEAQRMRDEVLRLSAAAETAQQDQEQKPWWKRLLS